MIQEEEEQMLVAKVTAHIANVEQSGLNIPVQRSTKDMLCHCENIFHDCGAQYVYISWDSTAELNYWNAIDVS